MKNNLWDGKKKEMIQDKAQKANKHYWEEKKFYNEKNEFSNIKKNFLNTFAAASISFFL